ncbi:MAG: hypothetical protein ACK4PI_03050 [Tepidisphaerales bacterium]
MADALAHGPSQFRVNGPGADKPDVIDPIHSGTGTDLMASGAVAGGRRLPLP